MTENKNNSPIEDTKKSKDQNITKQIHEAYQDEDSSIQQRHEDSQQDSNSHNLNQQSANHDSDEDDDDEAEWYNWEENADRDVVIKLGSLRLYYPNYYSLISLSLDIFVGILYFTGSLLFLSESTMMIGTVLFIIGGFFFFMRPVVKLYDNFRQYNQVGDKREKDDDEFDDDKFFDVIYSEEVPEEADEENQVDDYYSEYYDS